ncbi:MAG: hypothetical protein WAU01_12145 [Saprospiraceae bacterium]
MKKWIIILLVLCTKNLSAQAVYVEFLGKGWFYSINYEHHFSKRVDGWNVQIGAGFLPTSLVTVPASANYVFGKKNHHLELGLGLTYINGFIWTDDDKFGPDIFMHSNILYRYQKPEGKYFFKVGLTPLFSDATAGLWFGVGVGVSFFQ